MRCHDRSILSSHLLHFLSIEWNELPPSNSVLKFVYLHFIFRSTNRLSAHKLVLLVNHTHGDHCTNQSALSVTKKEVKAIW